MDNVQLANTGVKNIKLNENIGVMSDKGNKKIGILNLSGNGIENIDFIKNIKAKQIDTLSIKDNKIKSLEPIKRIEIGTIELNNNQISDFNVLKDIKSIYSAPANKQVIKGYSLKLDKPPVSIDSPFKGLDYFLDKNNKVEVATNVDGINAEYDYLDNKLTFKVVPNFITNSKEITTTLEFKFTNSKDFSEEKNYVFKVEDFKIIFE